MSLLVRAAYRWACLCRLARRPQQPQSIDSSRSEARRLARTAHDDQDEQWRTADHRRRPISSSSANKMGTEVPILSSH